MSCIASFRVDMVEFKNRAIRDPEFADQYDIIESNKGLFDVFDFQPYMEFLSDAGVDYVVTIKFSPQEI